MSSKKIWSLLLLFALSFSVLHDYTFSFIDTKHSINSSCIVDMCSHSLDKKADTICEIHHGYHSMYLFLETHISLQNPQKVQSLFVYTNKLFSLSVFSFLKPPIL